MTTDWAIWYLAGAYTALATTPPGWALTLAVLTATGMAAAR